jgi:histidyl-tRNA synthetase
MEVCMSKVEPKIMSGFMELTPENQIKFNYMYDTIKNTYESFGFLPIDTPILEYSEILLAKAGGETEKQIYSFKKGDTDISMRFDLTVPLSRYVSQHMNDITFPFKRYQIGKVYRGERPQKGRFREFYQCDIDVIGNGELSIAYDAELPCIIYNVFKKFAFGEFVIKINNRKILNGFFSSLGLSEQVTDILRIVDKIDKIGAEIVKEELIKIGVSEEAADRILYFINIDGSNDEIINALKNLNIENEIFNKGVEEIEQVINYLRMFNIPENNFKIALSIARGLDYYTGTVYETNLVDYPELGSICSGGRYDNLTSYYSNQTMPGVGISIGLTRLFDQLMDNGLIEKIQTNSSIAQVLIVDADNSNFEYVSNVGNILRQNNIRTDIYYGDKQLKNKMKYANKLAIPYVLIIGETEKNESLVTIKDMVSGEQNLTTIEEAIKIINKK